MSEQAGEDVERFSVSSLARVAENARLGPDVGVRDFAIIGRDHGEPVTVGAGTTIGMHAVIEPGCIIGSGCEIGAFCRLAARSELPDGTKLRSSGHEERLAERLVAAARVAAGNEPVSPHSLVAPNAITGPGVEIGPFAVVGWVEEEAVSIGARTKISPFALIEPGAQIGEDCVIDAFCRVASGARIGNRTHLLYGAAVFEDAVVGVSCIIGGDVSDRTVIEDCVTHFGETAHDYRHPGDLDAWDQVVAESATIRQRSVIGQHAVLVGGVTVGPGSYVSACERVAVDVPPGQLLQNRKLADLTKLKGLVEVRSDCTP